MMTSRGAVALAAESTDQESELRRRVLLVVPGRIAALRRSLDAAERALTGPDPEASLGYLGLLIEQADQAVADSK